MSFYFVYLLPLFLISFLFNTQQVFKTWIKTQVCTVQEPLVNIDVNQVYVIGKQINYIWLVSNEIANENQRKSYKSRHHIAVSAVVWRKERKEKIVDCETKVTIRKQTIKKVDSIQVYRKSERFFFVSKHKRNLLKTKNHLVIDHLVFAHSKSKNWARRFCDDDQRRQTLFFFFNEVEIVNRRVAKLSEKQIRKNLTANGKVVCFLFFWYFIQFRINFCVSFRENCFLLWKKKIVQK